MCSVSDILSPGPLYSASGILSPGTLYSALDIFLKHNSNSN
ncbi:14433_t:CDS:2 [Entrophospora sp. SA101]|nr:14433_t:CDS:2 [Entrophospora sp. SA101]